MNSDRTYLHVPLQFGMYCWAVLATALLTVSIIMEVLHPGNGWALGILFGGVSFVVGFPCAWFARYWD